MDKFQVVDCWILLCRSKEEIAHTQCEALSLLVNLNAKINCLNARIERDSSADDGFGNPNLLRGRALIATSKRNRLKEYLENALIKVNRLKFYKIILANPFTVPG